MPIINGVEIEIPEKAPEKIQRKIDTIESLKTDLKSEIDVKTARDMELSFGQFSFLDKQEDPITTDRKTRYQFFKEMDLMEFIHRALEIVSDDGSQKNDESNAIKIFSDDENIKTKLTELFFDRLDMNNELWSVIYETCKMGDNFYEVVVDDYRKPSKIVFLRYLEPEKVERIEINGRLSHFVYRTEISQNIKNDPKIGFQTGKKDEVVYKLQPWQIIHFRIENKQRAPFGGSLLEAGINTYKKLTLLEDVMLVYRISRAPERRVFYIDVGNLNKIEARQFLEKVKNTYRAQSFIDENGNINKKAHMLSITSDIFVPVREGSQGTRIETLQGGEALHNIDDMKYFKDKILRMMNIPPAYMGDETDRSRGSLSQLDIKFSRFIERIQSQIVKGLNKIAALELFFAGMKKDDLNNFEIELTPPSNIKEVTEIDLINQKMALLQTIQQLNLFSNQWMLKKIMRLSDKEISDIMLFKKLEAGENPQQAALMGGGGGGLAGLPPGGEMPPMGGEVPTGAPGEVPPEMAGAGAGAPIPAGAGGVPLAAGTIINMFGKEFIVENKKDFFRMLKLLEDVKQAGKSNVQNGLLREMADCISPVKKRKYQKTRNITRQFIVNELGGIDPDNKAVKLYEGYTKVVNGEKVRDFRMKKVLLG
jgi:hypothetical protein